jgi:hypothetical protein
MTNRPMYKIDEWDGTALDCAVNRPGAPSALAKPRRLAAQRER